MIVCTACSFASDEDATFCQSCGTFLEWTRDEVRSRAMSGNGTDPTVPLAVDPDAGFAFRSDFAPGEDGSIAHPDRRAPRTALPADDQLMTEAPTVPGGGVRVEGADQPTPVSEPRSDAVELGAGPPPPPAGISAPPPTMSVRPPDREWRPPNPRSEPSNRPPDPRTMRVLARPLDARTAEGRASAKLLAPVRNRRTSTVEVVAARAVELDDEPEDEVDPSLGPLLPGMQRTFDPVAASPVRAPSRTPQPGDVICHNCREANLPTRGFCRRCGVALETMVDITDQQPSGWWQRWWDRLLGRRRRRVARRRYRAGERPAEVVTTRGESRWRVRWRRITKAGRVSTSYLLALLAILALVGTVLPQAAPIRTSIVDTLEGAGQRVQRALVPQFVPVNPIAATASSSLPEHPVEQVVDGFRNRYWAEGAPGNGTGQTLTFTFQEPVKLAKLAFLIGGAPDGADFTTQPRPRVLSLTFDGVPGGRIEMRDEPTFQEHDVNSPEFTVLTIRIVSIYQAIGDGSDTAIGEIEFLRRL